MLQREELDNITARISGQEYSLFHEQYTAKTQGLV